MKVPVKYFSFLATLLALLSGTSCEEPTAPDEQLAMVHFHYHFRNELNTFDKTYQKDLVMDGVTSTEFWFTTEEQGELLAQAEIQHFYQFPDTIKSEAGVTNDPDPGRQFLRIKHEEWDHTVSWYYPLPEDHGYVPDLRALRDFLIELIESKPAYKSLPPARGGYI